MAVVGGLISAAGSIMQGMAGAQEAQYQAQIARNNAKIAEWNAEYANVKGDREGEAYKMKATNAIATMKARQGTSGVDVNVGSPMRVRRGAMRVTNLDALTIRNNTMREVWNYKTEATQNRAQAGLYEMQGRNAMMSGLLGGAASAASAVGSVSGKWNSYRSPTPYSPVSYGPSVSSTPMAVPMVQSSGSAQYGPTVANPPPLYSAPLRSGASGAYI